MIIFLVMIQWDFAL